MSQVSHKEQAKALKGADAFQTLMMSVLDWLIKNSRLIALALAPVVLVLVASFAWQSYNKSQKNSRLKELGTVQVVYDQELKKANDARTEISKQIDEIDKKISASTPPPPADGQPEVEPVVDPKLKTEKDQLEQKLAAIKPDHSGSVGKFQAFFDKYSGFPEGWMAAMTAARIYADQEKLSEARPILESVVAKSKDNRFYQAQARLSLIGMFEETAEYDKALAEIDQLDKLVDQDLKPRVLLAKGRLQWLKNDKEGAKATFNSLIEAHAASPEAQKARAIESLLSN